MRGEPSNIFPSFETFLASGGDARIAPDANGNNKYGCSLFPLEGLLSCGSSTASVISASGFAASERLYRRLQIAAAEEPVQVTYGREMERIRLELATLWELKRLPGTEIIFGASGTDLHLFAAQFFCTPDAAPLIIMPEKSETGSGVAAALAGLYFGAHTAFGKVITSGEAAAEGMDVVEVQSRFPDGTLRPEPIVDSEVEALVTHAVAARRQVLIVLTDVTKTGLITPRPECALSLHRRFPEYVTVLVDACQFRLSPATLRTYLQQDFLVAITGSKFVTGPAFSGALLVPAPLVRELSLQPLPGGLGDVCARADLPPGWRAREALRDIANYGLLLRFEAALEEMRAFYALPEDKLIGFLQSCAETVTQHLAKNIAFSALEVRTLERGLHAKSWDVIPTIFPFLLRHPLSGKIFSREETVRLYELMRQDLSEDPKVPAAFRELAAQRCLIGQPVACGMQEGENLSALRLAIDMRHCVEGISGDGQKVIVQILSVLDKAALLAEHLF